MLREALMAAQQRVDVYFLLVGVEEVCRFRQGTEAHCPVRRRIYRADVRRGGWLTIPIQDHFFALVRIQEQKTICARSDCQSRLISRYIAWLNNVSADGSPRTHR